MITTVTEPKRFRSVIYLITDKIVWSTLGGVGMNLTMNLTVGSTIAKLCPGVKRNGFLPHAHELVLISQALVHVGPANAAAVKNAQEGR